MPGELARTPGMRTCARSPPHNCALQPLTTAALLRRLGPLTSPDCVALVLLLCCVDHAAGGDQLVANADLGRQPCCVALGRNLGLQTGGRGDPVSVLLVLPWLRRHRSRAAKSICL